SLFVDSHNHPLTSPGRVQFLRSHRGVSKVSKALSDQLSLVNVKRHKQFEFFGVQAGGIENVGFTQRDLYNYGSSIREQKKGHDGDLLYMHFENEKEKDPSFVYRMESDEEKKTIIFACGFLNDETTDSFVWLFKEFLNVMPGNASENAPKMIITDQDPAMSKAISEALPHTFHRYCSWHILNKFSEKLDAIKYLDHYQDFHSCIWNSSSGDEFDSRWNELIEKSGLSDNKWLKSIYEIRSSWIPAHVNHCFSVGMSSSQRAESQHSFFKDYVSQWNTLVEFMVQFRRGLLHQRNHKLREDHINIEEKVKTAMSLDIEDDMAKVYTRKCFYEVQEQLKESFKYKLELLRENETESMFKVIRKNIDTSKSREVIYKKGSNFASCSCRKWEE
ncbi:PREDICTED: protein FAR1-RELATED SEQUENCE 5-like, partial [Fragaria vesca subsp. vesca]|uniref:protein FAR1-RELATED SEQUENCE 5-like n=1 Tax=Fragaria vesca subsp. vesca TaxID=101020 RepID=UPI0002C35D97